ncbi:hypothetical protein CB0940_06677 [Cercospora beticola]|uniref:BTB domain-containing protein n=1 Tax=Cercospora beticola TaxID=122368 RepID=A0A2G5HYU0_CERBT|nr:hypothetical protein CB0940_06677 [Cercospora beticola]PIA97671.1 hypothetical protein CB0940_06677 [Cercospora beticola]WPA99346.1 hypothetical protein RHO25_003963 [Cercospora beticola]CAK1360674.1 unnamed protein product [Cercospora beticola]
MSDAADIEVVAPDGDLLLIVGDEKKMQKKLRVSSHTLSSTSPVFKAMFGPHFQEGQQLRGPSNRDPVEIPLPDDDPRAMVLVCHLLHGRQSPTEDEKLVYQMDIFEVALIIDKYRVVDVLHWQIRGVFSHWLFDLDEDGYTAFSFVSTVAAAYLLNCDDAYNRATACFINHCEDEITELVDLPDMINTMPAQVLREFYHRMVQRP